MSELQAALLAIGLGAIVAVYGFGWWQQKRYRHKFGEVFKSENADALYHPASQPDSDHIAPPQLTDDAITPDVIDTAISNVPATEVASGQFNDRIDFIIELELAEPSLPSVLEGFWQRKFDFRKPVQVWGLTLNNRVWERVIAENKVLYVNFRFVLQLVDRGGAISEAKLADFSDLVLGVAQQINAGAIAPDLHETYLLAQELDDFCVAVDQMVGINLVPPGDRLIRAQDISRVAALHEMTLESDGAFHALDGHGNSLFSLINQDTVPFQHHTLETFGTAGITLLLDVPRVENPVALFERMMLVVYDLAEKLRLNIVDDRLVVLDDNGLESTRGQIVKVEGIMRDNEVPPGSVQARRLFS